MKYAAFTLSIILSFGFSSVGFAQDSGELPDDSDFEEVEELLVRKKRDKTKIDRKNMPRGPVTAMSSAGLLFASFDTNADYKVEPLEFVAGKTQAFNAGDENGNGILSLFELEAWRGKALGTLDATPGNMKFDADFDNRVTRQEFDTVLNRIFDRTDKDKNASVEFSELVRIFEMPDMDAYEERLKRDLFSQQRSQDRNGPIGGSTQRRGGY